MNLPEIPFAAVSKFFTVSYRYYSSGIPASDPLLVVDGLKTFQEAAEYALAIGTPGKGWEDYSPQKWDVESGTGTIIYQHTIHSTALEINIRPYVKFNVSLYRYIDCVPATVYQSTVFTKQSLKRFDDAAEDDARAGTEYGGNV